MKLEGFYSSGTFAKMAKVSVRTIRFYDKQNVLKPSYVAPSGARFYTDSDFAKLQQILLLKYLGFSLDDIRGMTINDTDSHFLSRSLLQQKRLIADKIEQMQLVQTAIDNTIHQLSAKEEINWSQMLELIHLTGMEKSLKTQFENANNIAARIRLHRDYSINKQGWFPWVLEQCLAQVHGKPSSNILELGCGDGTLWKENTHLIPDDAAIILSDISEGMLRDARRTIGTDDARFSYEVIDCRKIPYKSKTFDVVIANHLLFYCEDLEKVCKEIRRTLKSDGVFLCTTYGKNHMKEITQLAQGFDSRIVLAAENLYERFGLENGKQILSDYFKQVELKRYEDGIEINEAEPLIEYILSCHGNQNQYLLERYKDFRIFTEKKVKKGIHITKDAGLFICRK
uniref:MerR family transcriptional regulator n=1 Tax=Agathobacter sp. TaxID=2021311 RepID=UPI0040573DB5